MAVPIARVSALAAFCGALLAVLLGLPPITQDPATASPDKEDEPLATGPARPDVRDALSPKTSQISDYLIRDWPDHPRRVARALIAEYGPPDQSTTEFLAWHSTGPWVRSIVRRRETVHNFPFRHTDVLEQTVRYHVPESRVGELVRFDGSLIYDRTAGELSADCGSEEMNVLILNLADQIARGAIDAREARLELARATAPSAAAQSPPLPASLRFKPPLEPTADPDVEVSPPKQGP